MSEKSRQNLRATKQRYLAWIDAIDRAVHEIALTGTASATVSAGGGSKSYSRIDLGALRSLRSDYASRVSQINRCLAGLPSIGIRRVMTVRC